MNEHKHTPGPWAYSFTASGGATIRCTHEGLAVATVRDRADGPRNAHLVAAAPDMLATLVQTVTTLEANGWAHDCPCLMHLMRATIAKAIGA